jgi:signal peptidase complex subunit 3
MDLDVAPLFNWNVKQLFLYVLADYVTADGKPTSQVVWDVIIPASREPANYQIQLEDEQFKYPLQSLLPGELPGTAVTLTVHADVMPRGGLLREIHLPQTATFIVSDE